MIIPNDKENEALQGQVAAKIVTRSSGKLISEVNLNTPLKDRYSPNFILHKTNFCDANHIHEDDVIGIKEHSLSSSVGESTNPIHNQESFLNLFGLQLKKSKDATTATTTSHMVATDSNNSIRRKAFNLFNMEFSSQLGQLEASRMLNKVICETSSPNALLFPRYELNCTDTRCLRGEGNFLVTYRAEDHCKPSSEHKLCFNSSQRLERQRSLKYGLSTRSRLLLKQCIDNTIPVYRLPEAVITYWTSKRYPIETKLIRPSGGCQETELVNNGTDIIQLDDTDNDCIDSSEKSVTEAAGRPNSFDGASIIKHSYNDQSSSCPAASDQRPPKKRYYQPLITHLFARNVDKTLKAASRVSLTQNDCSSILPKKARMCSKLAAKRSSTEFSKSVKQGMTVYHRNEGAHESLLCDEKVMCLCGNTHTANDKNCEATTSTHTILTDIEATTLAFLEETGISNFDLLHPKPLSYTANSSNVNFVQTSGRQTPVSVSVGDIGHTAGQCRAVSIVAHGAQQHCFECLKCNTHEKYETNASRRIHDHIMHCFKSFEKVSLVTSTECKHHNLIYVYAF